MLQDTLTLANNGFAIHWLHPKSKRPIGKDWAAKPVLTPAEIKETFQPGNNIGVRTGKWSKVGDHFLMIIDIDVRNADLAPEALKKLKECLPEVDVDKTPMVRSGSGGASRHLFILSDKPFPSRKFAHSPSYTMVWDESKNRDVKKWDWELHMLGSGAQAVLPPSIHPETGKPYQWLREFDWLDVDLGLVDVIPSAAIERLMGYEDEPASAADPDRIKPLGMTVDEIRATLDDLPYEEWFEDRDGWFRTGMAIHHETSGTDIGFDLWCEYSRRSEKFNLRDSKRVWRSFKTDGNTRPFRMASLNAVANDVRAIRDFEEMDDDFSDDLGEDFEDQDDTESEGGDTNGGKSSAEKATKKAPRWLREMNEKHALLRLNGRTLVMDFDKKRKITYGNLSDLHAFYENARLPKGKVTVPMSKVWNEHPQRRTYTGVCFKPNGDEPEQYNMWQGFTVEPAKTRDPTQGCALFLKHLLEVVCGGNRALFNYHVGWLAHLVQKPEEKPGVAIVYKGLKRIGKDTVFEYVGKLISNHYMTTGNQEHVVGRFNPHLADCLLLHMQEGFWAGSKAQESQMKYLITSPILMVEPKQVNPFQVTSMLRLFISSNEDWVVAASNDEARFFVLNVLPTRRNDHAYFAALRAEMDGSGPSHLLAYLQQYDISDFQVRDVPDTEALGEQKIQGLKNVNRWWLEVLQRGEMDGIRNQGFAIDSDTWTNGPVEVDVREFKDNYNQWLRGRRYEGEELNTVHFGRAITQMLPSCYKIRRRYGGARDYHYVLQNLERCRAEFSAYLGSHVDWPEDVFETITIEEDDDL